MLQIVVRPTTGGWRVETGEAVPALETASGAQAEAEARRIAQMTAADGRPAEVRIYIRGGAQAGVARYGAAAFSWQPT